MKINNMNSPKFTSNFINYTQIVKTGNKKEKTPINATFIEIDTNNYDDIKALETVDKIWKNNTFASNIYYAAIEKRNKNATYTNSHIYALTLHG